MRFEAPWGESRKARFCRERGLGQFAEGAIGIARNRCFSGMFREAAKNEPTQVGKSRAAGLEFGQTDGELPAVCVAIVRVAKGRDQQVER